MGLEDSVHHHYSDLWLKPEDSDQEAEAWKGDTGLAWRDRNPIDVNGTNESWMIRFGADKIRTIREAAHGVPKDASWLEIGCSGGAHMRCMAEAGWSNVVGCDINLEAMATAYDCVQADARKLPFADGSVDGITTSGTLMHLGPEERMKDCVLEMARVTRDWLFFIELYHDEPRLVSFGDLMPPAWVMPWEAWLPRVLDPTEWHFIRGRLAKIRTSNDGGSLSLLLLKRAR